MDCIRYLSVVLSSLVGAGGSVNLLDEFYSDYLSSNGLTRPLIVLDSDRQMTLNLTAKADMYSVILFNEEISQTINEELPIYLKVSNQ